MSDIMRKEIDKVKKISNFLNENTISSGTMLNLIFSENEISELYEIKEKIATDYLNDLEIDTFSNPNEDDLINFIKVSFNRKNIKIDDDDMKYILGLVNKNILI